ncbi:hypothetical protein [Nocardia niwae]|nr:hypothetical protein [Nocardia niwae]
MNLPLLAAETACTNENPWVGLIGGAMLLVFFGFMAWLMFGR